MFAKDTLVLTNNGWVEIDKLSIDSALFDGEEYHNHTGSALVSVDYVESIDGLCLTPDQLISIGQTWMTARSIKDDPAFINLAFGAAYKVLDLILSPLDIHGQTGKAPCYIIKGDADLKFIVRTCHGAFICRG